MLATITTRRYAILVLSVACSLVAIGPVEAVQDLAGMLPGKVRVGPVAMQGEIVHRARDGSWLRFRVFAKHGHFSFRVEPTDGLPLPERNDRSSAGEDWSGEVIDVAADGAGFTGAILFGSRVRTLRWIEIESVPVGKDPPVSYRDVEYGPHERHRLDVYLPPTRTAAPVAIYIHGGAWIRGDKSGIRGIRRLFDAGIAVVAINYRYLPGENPTPDTPAVAWPLHDAARAVQFVRSQAAAWNLDPSRLGVWGESAGAYSALWIATHPDLADSAAEDPVARLSSRPQCVAGVFAQTSLDPLEMLAWAGPEIRYGPHAFAVEGASSDERFEAFLASRERLLSWINRYSPAALLTEDDGPFFLDYRDFNLAPSEPADAYFTHSPGFGLGFAGKARAAGVDCRLRYAGREDERFGGWVDFLIFHLNHDAGSGRASQS
jgi:acetyl esterase/lipase